MRRCGYTGEACGCRRVCHLDQVRERHEERGFDQRDRREEEARRKQRERVDAWLEKREQELIAEEARREALREKKARKRLPMGIDAILARIEERKQAEALEAAKKAAKGAETVDQLREFAQALEARACACGAPLRSLLRKRCPACAHEAKRRAV